MSASVIVLAGHNRSKIVLAVWVRHISLRLMMPLIRPHRIDADLQFSQYFGQE